MSSSIASQTLFNSGPHRFHIKPVGMLFVPPLFFDPLQTTINVITPLQLTIIQTGRLVGISEQDLWAQFNAIQLAAEAQLNGVLIDNNNISWLNMTFLRFSPADRVDRGRAISLAYTATHVKL